MTLATSAFTSYSAIGNREDLSDTIYRIDPTDTPFYSGIERSKASATKHEWQTQALAPAAANAQIEGDDSVTANATTATVRLNNYCQILTKIPRVTGTQRVVDHAGRDDEMTYQMMLKGMELKRDLEYNLLSNVKAVSGDSSTARKFATALCWMTSNTSKAGTDPTAADGTDTRTDGTQRAFTEAQFKTVISSCWTNGGKPDMVMTGAVNKQAFSTFTGRGTPMQDQADKKITASVDVYESDFGRLKIVANRFQRSRDVLVLQTDMWAYAPLPNRNFITFDLAKTGDTDKKQVLVEATLECRNEKSSGGVFDLTSS